MENKKITAIIDGTVLYCGMNEENGREEVTMAINEETAMYINSIMNDYAIGGSWVPVKEKDGQLIFKASTKYGVKMYGADSEELPAFKLGDIGRGSYISVYVSFKENTYRGKSGVSAYLRAVKIEQLEERTAFNPFK